MSPLPIPSHDLISSSLSHQGLSWPSNPAYPHHGYPAGFRNDLSRISLSTPQKVPAYYSITPPSAAPFSRHTALPILLSHLHPDNTVELGGRGDNEISSHLALPSSVSCLSSGESETLTSLRGRGRPKQEFLTVPFNLSRALEVSKGR
jgi:hypothetical protein